MEDPVLESEVAAFNARRQARADAKAEAEAAKVFELPPPGQSPVGSSPPPLDPGVEDLGPGRTPNPAESSGLASATKWLVKLPRNVGVGILDAAIQAGRFIEEARQNELQLDEDNLAALNKRPAVKLPKEPPGEVDAAFVAFRNQVAQGTSGAADEVTQGLSQFFVPFVGWSKLFAVSKAPSLAGKLGRGLAAESATMATNFDPHTGRLADLYRLGQESEGRLGRVLNMLAPDGSLFNDYINWMTSRENESEGLGRFKNVLDNLLPSAALSGVVLGFAKLYKAARSPAAPAAITPEVAAVPPEAAAPTEALAPAVAPSADAFEVLDNVREQIIPDQFVVPGSTVIRAGDDGFLAFAPDGAGNLQISRSTLKEEARGKGLGQQLLLKAARLAKERQLPLNSDDTVTVAQLRVYEALRNKGLLSFEYSNPELVKEALDEGIKTRPVKGRGRPVVMNIKPIEGAQ